MVLQVVKAISSSGLTIYDPLDARPELFIELPALERILNKALVGLDLSYPIRTRSKIVKSRVCEALGYPAPPSFRKTRPRFPGQDFDTYVQKSDNLQIWNEQVVASRRYVLIRVDERQAVSRVKVVTGEVIAKLDPTGKLTTKYQARSRKPVNCSRLVSESDTSHAQSRMRAAMLPIAELYTYLHTLVGSTIVNPGIDQERNRGAALHKAICKCLRIKWSDCGQFPDVADQLLEIKLQTASTIDLGLVLPDSTEKIASFPSFRHRDVRYAVFYGSLVAGGVRLDHLVLATGATFFTYFRRFEGKIQNAKLQIPLPDGFFR